MFEEYTGWFSPIESNRQFIAIIFGLNMFDWVFDSSMFTVKNIKSIYMEFNKSNGFATPNLNLVISTKFDKPIIVSAITSSNLYYYVSNYSLLIYKEV